MPQNNTGNTHLTAEELRGYMNALKKLDTIIEETTKHLEEEAKKYAYPTADEIKRVKDSALNLKNEIDFVTNFVSPELALPALDKNLVVLDKTITQIERANYQIAYKRYTSGIALNMPDGVQGEYEKELANDQNYQDLTTLSNNLKGERALYRYEDKKLHPEKYAAEERIRKLEQEKEELEKQLKEKDAKKSPEEKLKEEVDALKKKLQVNASGVDTSKSVTAAFANIQTQTDPTKSVA